MDNGTSKKVDIVFIDLDGTLTTSKEPNKVSIDNKLAIKNLQKKQKIVVIATGRSFDDAKIVWNQIYHNQHANYIISSNGARISNAFTDETLFEDLMTEEEYFSILQYIVEKFPEALFKMNGKRKLYTMKKQYWLEMFSKYFFKYTFEVLETFENFKEVDDIRYEKIGVFYGWSKKQIREIFSDIKNQFPNLSIVTSGNDRYVEITKHGINKGSAAKFLTKYLNMSMENSMCFGDSMNDLSLFEITRYPIFVNNGNPILKEKAYAVIKKSHKYGIAKVLENEVI